MILLNFSAASRRQLVSNPSTGRRISPPAIPPIHPPSRSAPYSIPAVFETELRKKILFERGNSIPANNPEMNKRK